MVVPKVCKKGKFSPEIKGNKFKHLRKMHISQPLSPKQKPIHGQGFTLLELVVTMTIAGILFGIAIPSFNEAIKNNRLTTLANDFVTSLNLARSEAVKRGQRVSICASTDGVTCADPGDWTQGWIVFNNPDNNDQVGDGDNIYDEAGDNGERVLKVQGSAQEQMTMATADAGLVNLISYVSAGTVSSSGSIRICDDRDGAKKGRAIAFEPTGRADTINCAATEYANLDESNDHFPAACKGVNTCP